MVVWGQLPVDVVPDGVHTRGPGVLRGSEVGSLLLNPSIFGPKPNGQCLAIMFGEGAISLLLKVQSPCLVESAFSKFQVVGTSAFQAWLPAKLKSPHFKHKSGGFTLA